jgi:hypothetical protein
MFDPLPPKVEAEVQAGEWAYRGEFRRMAARQAIAVVGPRS